MKIKLADKNYIWKSLVSQEGPEFQCDEFCEKLHETEQWAAYESNRIKFRGELLSISKENAGIFPAQLEENVVKFVKIKGKRYRRPILYDINAAQYEEIAPSKRGRKRKRRKHFVIDWDKYEKELQKKRKVEVESWSEDCGAEEMSESEELEEEILEPGQRRKREETVYVEEEALEQIKIHLKRVGFEKFGLLRPGHIAKYRGDYKVTASVVGRYLNEFGTNVREGKTLKIRRHNMLKMWKLYAPNTDVAGEDLNMSDEELERKSSTKETTIEVNDALEEIKEHLKQVKFEKFGMSRPGNNSKYRGDYKVTASAIGRYLNQFGSNVVEGKVLTVRRHNMLKMWELYAPKVESVGELEDGNACGRGDDLIKADVKMEEREESEKAEVEMEVQGEDLTVNGEDAVKEVDFSKKATVESKDMSLMAVEADVLGTKCDKARISAEDVKTGNLQSENEQSERLVDVERSDVDIAKEENLEIVDTTQNMEILQGDNITTATQVPMETLQQEADSTTTSEKQDTIDLNESKFVEASNVIDSNELEFVETSNVANEGTPNETVQAEEEENKVNQCNAVMKIEALAAVNETKRNKNTAVITTKHGDAET